MFSDPFGTECTVPESYQTGTEDSVPIVLRWYLMPPNDDDHREGADTAAAARASGRGGGRHGLILKAARDVLTVEPDTPMAEIAARAGVGVGSLYRRFPSKEALAYRLCFDGMTALSELARRTLEVLDDDPGTTSSSLSAMRSTRARARFGGLAGRRARCRPQPGRAGDVGSDPGGRAAHPGGGRGARPHQRQSCRPVLGDAARDPHRRP